MDARTRGARGRPARAIAAGALALAAAAGPSSAAAQAPRPGPDLVVTYLSAPPPSLVTGSTFNVVDVVRNPGRRPAPASSRRLLLSVNRQAGRGDYVLPFARRIGPLGIGRSARGSQKITMPSGIKSGRYYLISCADGARRVRETNERNNCRTNGRAVDFLSLDDEPDPNGGGGGGGDDPNGGGDDPNGGGGGAPNGPVDPGNPLAAGLGWLNPDSSAAVWARSLWRNCTRTRCQYWSRLAVPSDSKWLSKVAAHPVGNWFGNWNGVCNRPGEQCGIEKVVGQRAYWAEQQGSQALLVTFALQNRVCTGERSGRYVGGFASDTAYREWIREYAEGIGQRKAIVIVEPDALPDARCMSDADRKRRFGLVSYAVQTLTANPGTTVYIDAGRSGWRPAGEIAAYLRQSGIDQARGFSLNVTALNHTNSEKAYCREVSKLVGGKRCVINTGRNGFGPLPKRLWRSPKDEWCNPPGRALGPAPSTNTGDPVVDGFLWIRAPGESETVCYPGHPPAGRFWPEYAIGLAQRARW